MVMGPSPCLRVINVVNVLNVALGGSLVQDVSEVTGERHGWAARYPDQVPLLNGEFEYIARLTPEACE